MGLVIPGYTGWMKTAISVPDDTFERATERARELGMSRSELFTRAAESYLEQLETDALTEQIDRALQDVAHDDSSSMAAAAAARHRLSDEPGW